MALNNNQIYTILNTAMGQALGKNAIANVGTLSDIIELGKSSFSSSDIKDNFFGALVAASVKMLFEDEEYTAQLSPWFKDSQQFRAITRLVSIEMPDVQPSHAWQTYTSGSSTVGTYTVFIPTLSEKYYYLTNHYELPVFLAYDQIAQVFEGTEGASEVVNYVFLCAESTLSIHLEDIVNLTRNNAVLEKLVAENGIYNLVEMYQDETGDTSITTALAFMNTPKCMLFAAEKIRLYKKYLQKKSVLYNVGSHPTHVPASKLVTEVLAYFDEKVKTIAMSDTYHDDMVAIGKYSTIAYWQGFGSNGAFADVSKIDGKVTVSGTATEKTISGVVAVMGHQNAINITMEKRRVATKHFDPEAMDAYYYQFDDKMGNDLTKSLLIFVVQDHAAES